MVLSFAEVIKLRMLVFNAKTCGCDIKPQRCDILQPYEVTNFHNRD